MRFVGPFSLAVRFEITIMLGRSVRCSSLNPSSGWVLVQVAETKNQDSYQLFEGVSDSDLVDGAGQVILEFLESNFGDMNQMEILDVRDLMSALGSARLPAGEDVHMEEMEAVLARALRLLDAGYYRSLLVEERERVGRINYRLEAMMRFKERILKDDTYWTGLGSSHPTL